LNTYKNFYNSLGDKVNQKWNQINVEQFITPRDKAVRDIVYTITSGWSDPSDWNEFWTDVLNMYYWVINNIKYNGLYQKLPNNASEDLDFCNEMWQFPDETLMLRQGDCEDMAILLCSMIRCYSNTKCLAECIIIEFFTF